MYIYNIIIIILLLVIVNSIYLSIYKENNMENFGITSFNDVGLKCLSKNSPLYKPYKMFIKVVLPAPFSPNRARISPLFKVISI